MNNSLRNVLESANSIGITGHVRPDGDCLGSCMTLYLYIKRNYPDKTVTLYLEEPPKSIRIFPEVSDIDSTFTAPSEPFDLFVVLDCSSADRFPAAEAMFRAAKNTFVVDHHMTNSGFSENAVVVPDASSTCEVLYGLLEDEKIDTEMATALYMGIIHDTGIFKYSACKESTMQVAGKMLSKGVNAQKLIDETFYQKSYVQNRLIGYAVLNSELKLDGKMIVSKVSLSDMQRFEATPADTEGTIDQLRLTRGVEVAVFAREDEEQTYKFSLRAVSYVNVAKVCEAFGGGGHRFAAGCTIHGEYEEILEKIISLIQLQL